MSLRRQAARSVGWTATATASTVAIRLAQTVIVARLLPPADLGLYAIVNLVLGFAGMFADAGISQGIVARQDTSDDQMSTLYWANLAVGSAVGAVVLAASPAVAWAYGAPRLAALLPLAAATFPLAAAGQPYQALLQKRLAFGSLAGADIAANLAGAAATVALAAGGAGVLALAAGQVLFAALRSLILVAAGGRAWRPAPRLDLAAVRPHLRFGLFQMGERTVNYLNTRLDQLLIGSLAGAEALGYYTMAWMMIVDPIYRLSPVITTVAFPVFALKQDDPAALRRGFLIVVKLLATVNAPLLLGFAALAPQAVPLLLGPGWEPTVPLVQLLAAVGIARAIGTPTGSLVLAVGRADRSFAWSLIQCALQAPVYAVLLAHAGLIPATVYLGLLTLSVVPMLYVWVIRPILGPSARDYALAFLPAVTLAAGMAAAVWGLGRLAPAGGAGIVALQVAAGAALYSGALCLARPGDLALFRTLAARP